ncbi:4-hydroxythreonine-4-phosphate dehydrogenase [Sinomonas atrocyanea]|uniref:4-hydroxythreonine-4-phosphate dehydrogenase PdxA n=1 Tax=Sinomonas atrocyanea TaxID=37927 RepID=UPI00277DDB9B|nr:4-hydroxythreonine-4-phosphate dehydrogenase PdxA [Sinomonas atrocyanea]MDP9884281.1 4-hydroxythreonine-4-phosphate dehydrogenase [Sinomonas atrocyanea]
MAKVLVQADDFSGAAEVGQQFTAHGFTARIALTTAGTHLRDPSSGTAEVVILDTHTRSASPTAARAAVRTALTSVEPTAVVFKKTDSLWRGNVGPELSALAELGYDVVLAGAFPAMGRTVVGGEPSVAGVPLRASGLWSVEPRPAPENLSELFATDSSVRFVGLDEVRSPGLTEHIGSVLAGGDPAVVVVDGETEADLSAVVEAVVSLRFSSGRRPVALAGTGQLAGLLAQRLAKEAAHTAHSPAAAMPATVTDRGAVLAVVGSASPAARRQLEHLGAEGFDVVDLPSHEDGPRNVRAALAEGRSIALTVPAGPQDPARSAAIVARLAQLARQAQQGLRSDLILTGGETAREILDALGIASLIPIAAVQHGAVVCMADDGRLVATKPGSFGDPLVLAQLYRAIQSSNHPRETTETSMTSPQDDRPFIAVTMGDGAGIGPEVTVGALIHAGAYADSRPVVIGDAHRLRLAAEALGVAAEIVTVQAVEEAEFTLGRVNVIDPELLPADLPWGIESAEAGNAAYHYVRIACGLAMAGKVQGICTAPLNKAALHRAGHVYPGHTELLAHFMGVDEVSMMLSTPKVKVIHVTTHIGLVDAIRKIEPGLVERTVRRGDEAMKRAGVAHPTIGVCAINPHAGENGLFGYGEEEEKIVPAIAKLQADGIDARGPLPADTAFFLAGRGDYDLIVAMYHDQGHGPVKVLGIEAGVNITVGLPVIRTSVDHGTAFDIAGKGIADVRSMIEALRQAAEMSPRLALQQ